MNEKILVVDDEPEFLELIKIRLEANGYSVYTLDNPAGVLAAAREHRPEVILLDIGMPGLDGYSAARELKKDKVTAGIAVILLSGKDLLPQMVYQKCRELGARGFIAKPVDTEILLGKIRQVLQDKA